MQTDTLEYYLEIFFEECFWEGFYQSEFSALANQKITIRIEIPI